MFDSLYSEEEPRSFFDIQEDGWPNAGQVLRFFQEKSGMTAKAFGKLYGNAIRKDGRPICERWILEMELENKVPSDITRRRVIVSLLHIPPALLGLAALSDVIQKEQIHLEEAYSSAAGEKFGIAIYERNIHRALHLHLTSGASVILSDIKLDRARLEFLARTAQDSGLLHKIKELLFANDLLAAKISRDQRKYPDAYRHANNAVLVAEDTNDSELMATAYYTRGCIKLQWGQFGQIKEKGFQLQGNKIKEATYDLQNVLDIGKSYGIALHPQLHGFVLLQLSRAKALLHTAKYDPEIPHVLRLTDEAANFVEHDTIDDLYTRMIVTGTVSGLHIGAYYLTCADIFTISELPDNAIAELGRFKHLADRAYGKDETRNLAWHNIVLAKALLGLREYPDAAKRTKEALIACLAINSVQNIVIISSIYNELKMSSYREACVVKEIGKMLEG